MGAILFDPANGVDRKKKQNCFTVTHIAAIFNHSTKPVMPFQWTPLSISLFVFLLDAALAIHAHLRNTPYIDSR